MRIEVAKIGDNPLQLRENIAASLWGMDSFDVRFVDDVCLDCSFIKISKEVIVTVRVTLGKVVRCSRCLEESQRKEQQTFELNYNTASLGEYLEIDQEVREQILLNFPMKVLCKPDCKGLCPVCGENLNLKTCSCQIQTK